MFPAPPQTIRLQGVSAEPPPTPLPGLAPFLIGGNLALNKTGRRRECRAAARRDA
jgi:hypothetical protein